MFISSPEHKERRNQVTYAMSSHLDILPTILDWYQITPKFEVDLTQNALDKPALTGISLLPLLVQEPPNDPEAAVFASQSYHEVTMDYPMRSIRTKRYKLIHNLNFRAPFPIDQDFYVSPTFQVCVFERPIFLFLFIVCLIFPSLHHLLLCFVLIYQFFPSFCIFLCVSFLFGNSMV